MTTTWRRIGPGSGRRWPAAWAGGAASLGAGAALGGLPGPLLIALGSTSALLAVFAGWWTLAQRKDARLRGTVYVVREPAASWEDDEAQFREFLSHLVQEFSAVREVPGPVALHRWYWPLDGAQEWDQRLDELVTALRILRRDDRSGSLQSLVVWARWPVSIALLAQVLAAERGGPRLLVRQRVSDGRRPGAARVDFRQPALAFGPAATGPTTGASLTHRGTFRASRSPAGCPVRRGGRPARVRILLIRLTDVGWGPLELDPPSIAGLGPPKEDKAARRDPRPGLPSAWSTPRAPG